MSLPNKAYNYDQENPNAYTANADRRDTWNNYIFFVAITAALSSFSFGYNISAIDSPKIIFGTCNPSRLSPNFFSSCIPVDEGLWKYVVSAFCVGGLIGALLAGKITNIFGRKRIIVMNNIMFILGTVVLSLSPNFTALVLARILIGMASGICTVVVPMYLSEIAPDAIRGQVSIIHQSAIVLGIFIAQILAFPLSNPTLWRLYFFVPGIFSVIALVFLTRCPESPKFLAENGNIPEATQSLQKLRQTFDVSEEVSRLESSRQQRLASNSVKSMTILDLIKSPAARKSLIISVAYHAIQQFSGINAVFFFSTTLFSGIGVNEKVISVCIGALNIFMTGISIALMDKAGRKPLALVSTLVMALGCLGIVIALSLNMNALAMVFIALFVGGFAVGLGPVPWVILGDIFPSSALDAGVTLALGVNWTSQILLAFLLLPIRKLIDHFVFLLFAGFLFMFLVFNFLYVPETKGKPAQFL